MPEGHRFPMNKFYHVLDTLKKDGMVMRGEVNLFRPMKASWTELSYVHEQNYLKSLQNLSLSEKELSEENRPSSKERTS